MGSAWGAQQCNSGIAEQRVRAVFRRAERHMQCCICNSNKHSFQCKQQGISTTVYQSAWPTTRGRLTFCVWRLRVEICSAVCEQMRWWVGTKSREKSGELIFFLFVIYRLRWTQLEVQSGARVFGLTDFASCGHVRVCEDNRSFIIVVVLYTQKSTLANAAPPSCDTPSAHHTLKNNDALCTRAE